MERLAKERLERNEAYEREKREKEEKHRRAMEVIMKKGNQLLGQDCSAAGNNRGENEDRPLARRPDSGLQGQAPTKLNAPKPPTAEANIFKMDEQQKPRTPGFRGGNNNHNAGGQASDLWPQTKPSDDIGSKIKNYIKDINKLIDSGMGQAGDGAGEEGEDEDEDEDDENIEEVPTVPETDENSK